jgi:hypothetical protein
MCAATTFSQYLSDKLEVNENVILRHYPQLSGIALSSAFKDELIYNSNHRMHYHRDGPKIDGCKTCDKVLFKNCDILNKFICFKEYCGDLKIKSKSHQLNGYKNGIDYDDQYDFTVYMDVEDVYEMKCQDIF